MPSSNSPLRYPGGKGRLANFVKLLLLKNDLRRVHYVEPYAGGAGLGITLLLHDFASTITINDIDPLVHSFWKSVVFDTTALCRRISKTRVSMAEWYRQRDVIENRRQHSTLDIGFAAFFLNRTNRSGIIRGGVIGGLAQKGEWKLSARFNKKTLISRIQTIGALRNRINIRNIDACDLLSGNMLRTKFPRFWYLDPPYFVKGQKLYENHYIRKDHQLLVETLSDIDEPWLVSYDDAPEIRQLFRTKKKLAYKINYSAADRYSGGEIAFFSPVLRVPKVESPFSVTDSMIRREIKKRQAVNQ